MNPKMCKTEIYDIIGCVLGERYRSIFIHLAKGRARLNHLSFNRFMGKGLLTEPHYEVWKPRRSLYDPSFSKV